MLSPSQNFPADASVGFSYSSSADNPGPGWLVTTATAGSSVALHFLATALHVPSHFEVYLTKATVDPDSRKPGWARCLLGHT